MTYWQTPQVNYLDPSGTISEPTSMFLASMQAGASARLKKQQFEQQERRLAQDEAFRQQQHLGQLWENYTDNERDKERIELERQRLKQDDEREKARIERDEKRREEKDNEEINKTAQDDPATAEFIARNRGRAFAPATSANVQAPLSVEAKPQEQAPAQPTTPTAGPMPFGLFGNPLAWFDTATTDQMAGRAGGVPPTMAPPAPATLEPAPLTAAQAEGAPIAPPLVPQAAPSSQPQAAPQAAAPAATPTQQPSPNGFMIGGIYASGTAAADTAQRKLQRQIAQGQEIVDRLAPLAVTPIEKRAVANVKALIQSGALPPDKDAIAKAYTDRVDALEQREATEKNARITASLRTNLPTPGERADTAKAVRLRDLATELFSGPTLSKDARQAIIQHAADEAAFEKSPTAKALAIRTRGYTDDIYAKLPNEADQVAYNLLVEVASDILRKESGAAISATEWRNVFARYMPGPGDSDAVIARKQRNLLSKIDEFAAGSRTGYGTSDSPPRRGPAATRPNVEALKNRLRQKLGGQ